MWIIREIGRGIADSVNYIEALRYLYQCKEAHKPLVYSFWLTGVVFMGSLLFYNFLVQPFLQGFPQLFKAFTYAYYILWVFPVYFLSFILNSILYSDIAHYTFEKVYGNRKVPKLSVSRRIALEVHRGFLIGVNLLILSLISVIPYTEFIVVVFSGIIYSFYCFEYRWIFEGKTINSEIDMIEGNIFYYAGFGLIFALSTYFFPLLIGNGVWAMVFPVFMLTALLSKPTENLGVRVPFFYISKEICEFIEIRLFRIN